MALVRLRPRRRLLQHAAALVLPWVHRAAPAQPRQPARIAVLYPGPMPGPPGNPLQRFREALEELGLADGQAIMLDVVAEARGEAAIQAQVEALLQRKPALIVAGTTASALVCKRVAGEVPVVMAVSADPVRYGLVASLGQPGGHVTGMSILSPELSARRLQLITEAVPGLQRVGVLIDVQVPAEFELYAAAARTLGVAVQRHDAATAEDLAPALRRVQQAGVQALVVGQSTLFNAERARLAALTLEHRLPAVAGTGDGHFARAGGLMNFGADIGASWHRSASFVHRILNGARPAALPVEVVRKFHLVINRGTATTLGLKVPPHLVALADEVVG